MIARLLVPLLLVTAIGGCGMSESVPAQENPFDAPEKSLTDEQARAQVVEPARALVAAVPLDDVTGGFSFGSCNDQGEPPYQGRVEVTFRLPVDPDPVYAQIREALTAQGWASGAPDGQVVHGTSLHRDGVTATVGPRAQDPGYGSLQFYGECGNTGDHGAEGAADITPELR